MSVFCCPECGAEGGDLFGFTNFGDTVRCHECNASGDIEDFAGEDYDPDSPF